MFLYRWLLLLSFTVHLCYAWDSDELQMFDVIDELKQNFYDFLGVEKDASQADIRRAYRRLSVKLHPDKNIGDPEAADKFRQLATVYEVLKDEERRKSYDDVLEHGLPDWRSSVFYYRKLRKMSNWELGVIFSVLSTTIHYAALWGSRFEKSWTLEDQLSTFYKRHKARDRKREEIDALINTELNKIPRPKWHDLLPFAICKGMYSLLLAIPLLFQVAKDQVSEKIEEKQQTWREQKELEEKKKAKAESKERKRRGREKVNNEPFPYDIENVSSVITLSDLPSDGTDETDTDKNDQIVIDREWSEDDITELVRAVARFPGGVPGRWERIASQLNRTVSDVAKKTKELGEKKLQSFYQKSQFAYQVPAFETNINAVCGESSDDEEEHAIDGDGFKDEHSPPQLETVMTVEEEDQAVIVDEPYMSRKKQKQLKSVTRSDVVEKKLSEDSSDGWTQVEQKQLEVAIRSILKTTPERWDRIADCIPTKTKAEVLQRVKHLSSMAKSKPSRS